MLSAMRQKFGGHVEPKSTTEKDVASRLTDFDDRTRYGSDRSCTHYPRNHASDASPIPASWSSSARPATLRERKLIPALYNLASQQLLSREFAVVGVGRTPMTNEEARKKFSDDFKQFATGSGRSRSVGMVRPPPPLCFAEISTIRLLYDRLKEELTKVEKDHTTHGNVFFYLATAPNYFCEIVQESRQSRT